MSTGQSFPRTRLAGLVLAGVLLAGPAWAETPNRPPPTPAPVIPGLPTTVPGLPEIHIEQPDPEMADCSMLQRTLGTCGNGFREKVVEALRATFEGASVAMTTPEFWNQLPVRTFWITSLVLSNAILAALLLVGALNLAIPGREHLKLQGKDLVQRVVVYGAIANLSMLVAKLAVEASNTLAMSILRSDPSALVSSVERITGFGAGWVLGAIAIGVLVGGFALLVVNVIRVVLLALIIMAGPIFLAAGVLPQTDFASRSWAKGIGLLSLAPVAQALLLQLAVGTFFTGGGLGFGTGGVGTLFDGIIILVLTFLLFYVLWRAIRATFSTSTTQAMVHALSRFRRAGTTLVRKAVVKV